MDATRRPGRGAAVGPASMLVLCARVGEARHVPPGYATADCVGCGLAVWIGPDVLAMAEGLRMPVAPLCNACSSRLARVV